MNTPTPDLPPMSLKDWYVFAWTRRTTILGYMVSILGFLGTEGEFSPRVMKGILLVSGLMTAALGHFNNRQLEPKL